MITRTNKDLKGFNNSKQIKNQITVPYGVNDLSRYKHIDELLLTDGKTIKATLGPIDLSVYPYDVPETYTVTEQDEDCIDIIAYKVYGQASLYWAICYANNIKDPLKIPLGTTLYIPSLDELKQFPNPLS